ncbi:hypothetical protein Patl1_18888 [Pistacia atlantica]|uniref:Uncharacterized protein n=1 Tax=Pistacia atlantica TaxID=434234 RepID=A0ACC1BYT3_9ROSI|nr:hypothetical protein Patl1_18888 [Pistacia atlantica]
MMGFKRMLSTTNLPSVLIAGSGRRKGREVCEEGNNSKEVEEMKIDPIEEESKLKFDFAKPNHDDGADNACKPPKPGVPKVEKTGTLSILVLPINMS